MIVHRLINVGKNVCSECAFYVYREGEGTMCRFPKGAEKKCSVEEKGDSWVSYRVYHYRYEEI